MSTGTGRFPRKVMLGGSALALVCVFGWRLIFDIAARGAVQARPVLFLGLSPTVLQLAGHFRENPEFGMDPIGYLGNAEGPPTASAGMSRLGALSELSTVLEATRPSSVVIGGGKISSPGGPTSFWNFDFPGSMPSRQRRSTNELSGAYARRKSGLPK